MKEKSVEKTYPINGGYPLHSFDDLKSLYFTYILSPKDRKLIEDAYLFASEKHKDQKRKGGEPYIHHPLEVAYIVASLQAGPSTIASALLHDVVEDCGVTIEEIEKLFGEEIAKIVDSLTKIQRMKLSHRNEQELEVEDHKKIFLGMARDIRVIIVKLADRLHNMRTLDPLSEERKKALSNETLAVFTPIAHRLGVYSIQSELEDLSLKYSQPEIYAKIKKLVEAKSKSKKKSLEAITKRIADSLFEKGIQFRIESRVKSIYSIYRKMYIKGHSFEEIYDVMALRIICQSEADCYAILGSVHQLYKPIPGRFKDYIAMPKPNMYQSLHTSIVSGDGQIYEVQIRTEDMDKIAETGIAAHWKYKEGSSKNAKDEQKEIEQQLHWFRDFVSMSYENSDSAKEYMDSLTNDVFGANVYVFTPKGKVIDLPSGATPLDFAYRIHTKVGDSAVGAVVNGIGVPLNTVLKTGDVCEIRTSKTSSGPNEGWLEIAKTSSAKAHIKKALQRRDAEILREERIKNGKASCIDAFKLNDIDEVEMEKYLDSEKVRNEYHFEHLDDLYVMMASKNPTPGNVIDFLGIRKKADTEELVKKLKPKESGKPNKIPIDIAGGVSNLAVSFAQCCSPIPGDDIVGFISKGKGVVVHRRNCPNIANSKRLLEAKWNEDLGITNYPVDIEIKASDRPSLVADVLTGFGSKGIGVSDLNAHLSSENSIVTISLTIRVSDAKVLEDSFAHIQGIKGVISIRRVIH